MYIDLTHTIKDDMPFYPGTPPPSIKRFCQVKETGYAEMKLEITTHTGTHIDAPAHIIEGGKTLDNADLCELCGTAALFDCKQYPLRENRIIDAGILEGFLNQHSQATFLVIKTGWSQRWADDSYYHGFPVLSEEAARLVVKKGIKIVCSDTISADRVEDANLPVHKILLTNGVMIAENLTSLEKITASIFRLYVIPLKIKDSDGSPARIFAEI